MPGLVEIPRETCVKLLRAGAFGRIVLTTPEQPEIVPVNYVTVGDAVLVRTSSGSLLDRHAAGAELLFEIDGVDYERWHGWSVVARGPGERFTADDLPDEVGAVPGPPAWVPRAEPVWIRLAWRSVSGRQVGQGWTPLGEMPVRRSWH